MQNYSEQIQTNGASPTQEALEERALEQKARRAARKAGFILRKSRGALHANNEGWFRLVEPYHNTVEAGINFDLRPDWVIEYCKHNQGPMAGKLK